jgi:hypothetical protein
MNGDGSLTSADTDLFGQAMCGKYPQATYPDIDPALVGDYNDSGMVNLLDFKPFTSDLASTSDNFRTPAPLNLQAASDSGVSSTDNITSDNTPTFDVSVWTPYFRVYRDSVRVSGEWETASTWTDTSLSDGTYSYQVATLDSLGNQSPLSSALSVSIDTQAPSAPSAPDLQAGSDSGVSSTDNITNATSATFDINTGGAPYYRVYCDSIHIGGQYESAATFTDSNAGYRLEEAHGYVVEALDAAGNRSSDSSILSVTFDRTAPSAPSAPDLQSGSDSGVSSTDNITNDYTPTFDVSASPYFRFYRGASKISGDYESGSTYTAGVQADGTYDYKLAAVDTAGNESGLSSALNVTIDATAPTVTWNVVSGTEQNPWLTGADSAGMTFSEAVYGLGLDNLYLRRVPAQQGGGYDNIDISGADLDTSDNITWTVSGLKTETSAVGTFAYYFGGDLHLDSGLTDKAGNTFQVFGYTVNGHWHAVVTLGDLNANGSYDYGDFTAGYTALYNHASYEASYPNTDEQVVGDMDDDGDYDADDFAIISYDQN